MENYHFSKFKSAILPNDALKSIKGGDYYESLNGSSGCSATALCKNGKSVSCTGVGTSCSGTDYDRVVCDSVATNCPEC